jgi:dTDP-glucose 4,6-dehydratase
MLIGHTPHQVLVVDKLTYAANLDSIRTVMGNPRFRLVRADICDAVAMCDAFNEFMPDVVLHLAAETHVDRSIDGPRDFVDTNVVGTFVLLQSALDYWSKQRAHDPSFRFHHVSTDEVFGSLGPTGAFHEESPYRPNSPYAASKAASDHFVRAWHQTYGLPVVVSNCSNNYGPYQFPEKLIPLTILNALEGKLLPVYGTGANVRDWLHVDDHARALMVVAESGRAGETYNIGGGAQRTNLEVVRTVCELIDQLRPDPAIGPRERLITFVDDRPGHDLRYAMDCAKIVGELGWSPRETFKEGLAATVRWYIEHRAWWERIRAGVYRGERLGLVK